MDRVIQVIIMFTMMAIKSEIKQWMFHKVALLNHCFQVEFSGGRKTIGRGENPRLLMDCVSCQTSALFFKPSISNISVFSSSMASFVPTCVFIVSSKIFFNCFSLKTNISFSPSSGGNFRNDYSKYYKALCW